MMTKFYLIFIVALVAHQATCLPQPETSLKEEAEDVYNKAKENIKEFMDDVEDNGKSTQQNVDKFLKVPSYDYKLDSSKFAKGLDGNNLLGVRSLFEDDFDESENGPAKEPRGLDEELNEDEGFGEGYEEEEENENKQPRSFDDEEDEDEEVETPTLQPRSFDEMDEEESAYEGEPEE